MKHGAKTWYFPDGYLPEKFGRLDTTQTNLAYYGAMGFSE